MALNTEVFSEIAKESVFKAFQERAEYLCSCPESLQRSKLLSDLIIDISHFSSTNGPF